MKGLSIAGHDYIEKTSVFPRDDGSSNTSSSTRTPVGLFPVWLASSGIMKVSVSFAEQERAQEQGLQQPRVDTQRLAWRGGWR